MTTIEDFTSQYGLVQKIDAFGYMKYLAENPDAPRKHGKVVLVTADTPLKASRGEGKTTTTIALIDALNKRGIDAAAVLRQPSMGITAAGSKGGASGGGKTTLCNLIPRFYEVTSGRILIDGQDIRRVTLKSLRQDIGIVQQDVYLFSGTVAQNIAYGKPGATRQEIEAAARLAGAEKFILALKDGYDTYVGERGVKLSGGQKQRIAIARVFLKNPPILILDEATSALDNESEILVGQSLEKLAHGRTTLTIAHRLTTIKDYDRILVLGEEGIVEQGTHAQLLEKQGIYYRLWNQLPAEDGE